MNLNLPGGARCEAGIDVVEDTRAGETGVQIPRAAGIAFDDCRKADEIAGAAQFANDPEMIAAEGPDADNGKADGLRRGGSHSDYGVLTVIVCGQVPAQCGFS